ncbi:MAG TPA: S41 family peptidase [Vicinamibacterales bacterium]|nr:S41 family peptidase [Vicinamibacterales bacterium]
MTTVAAGLVLAMAGLSAVGAQSWRQSSLAAFDEVWQTIHDTYYDPTFGDLDWKAVREEFRPRVEAAVSGQDVREIIREMLARLGQSHFMLIAPSTTSGLRGDAHVAIDVRLIGRDVVITRVDADSAASTAGLVPGQIIRRVGEEPASRWFEAAVGPNERVRATDTLARAAAALSGPVGSPATLVVAGADGERTVQVARERERGQVVQFGNLPPLVVRVESAEHATPGGRRAGVIVFSMWMPAAAAKIDAAIDEFRAADGLILDLRGNPGGIVEMMRGVAGHLIDEEVSLGRVQTRAATLELRVNPRRSTRDGRTVTPFAGPVAILVDELTGSASECFAGSLQSLGRVRVFGRTTMGQALPAATRKLVTGDILMHVLGDFVTPSGTRLEGQGVEPDEVVPLTVADLRAGRDRTLEAALAWIDRAPRLP